MDVTAGMGFRLGKIKMDKSVKAMKTTDAYTLKDLDFKDIYLGEKDIWFAGGSSSDGPFHPPASCLRELAEIRELCLRKMDESSQNEFAISFQSMAFRVSLLTSLNETVFVLRRLPSEVPTLSKLNIHSGYLDHFRKPNLSGLVVISGAYGQGKTTTASAIVAERLKLFGGVAITIEDPPEMPLEGVHGKGICYQTWVDHGGFGEACRKTARYAPDIIFMGEIRDADAAGEALRASINGRLVICTIHADSVATAIERIYSLANGAVGSSEDTSSLLANGLLAVMNQKLEGSPLQPKIEHLWLGDEETRGVRNIIRMRRFDQVANEITLQLNRMLMQVRNNTNETLTDINGRRRQSRT